jgi:PAS domain S-box-containing protein
LTPMMDRHPSDNPSHLIRRKSLAAQLTWVSIVMVALAVVAVGTGLIVIAHRTQREAAFQMQRRSAEQVSQLISVYMSRAIDRLPFFLENAQLTSQPPERQKAALENLLMTSLPLYSQVSMLDKEGKESIKVSRFHTFLPEELTNQAESPPFLTAIRGGVYVGPVAFLWDAGILSVPIALPIRTPTAQIAGVMVAEVNVTHLWQDVARIKVGQSGYAYLVDKQGRFVAYQKPAEVLQRYGEDMRKIPPVSDFIARSGEGTGSVREYRGLVDEEVIGVYCPIKGTDWAVVVEQPTREAYASISKMERYLLGVMALCILLAGGLGFYVSRRLIGPIRVLTDAAQRLAAGDLKSEFKEVQRQDEVGILSKAFKEMQGELQDLYAGQKQRIEKLEIVQKALRESEEKYRTILESIEDGYYEVDLAGHFVFFNDSLCDIYGYPREELMGMNIRRLTDAETAETGNSVFNQVYGTGKAEKGFSWPAIRKEGAKRSVEASVSLRRNSEGEPIGFRGIVRDISEKQRLEARLQHAQRMESIGTLAGGIAHNFNNLLMGILGYSSLMLMETESDHPNYNRLKNIEKQVLSGSKLTSQLLGYAREGSYEVRPINLNRLVKETSDTFAMTRKDITVHHDFYGDLNGIRADQGQIEQVLLNLYINAADAMPGGGDLFLKSRNVTHKDMTEEAYEMKPGEYVLLSVRDTGAGMKQGVRERIFEPFFTTKGLAGGTGLGLASAYGIIKAHGGYINVYSEEGHGATFNIYLPASHKATAEARGLPEDMIKGRGTVLLVDDEQIILEAAEQMLQYLGYDVLLAENGQEAVDLYRKNRDRIDMVLLDMVMPVMGGGETFDRIKEINPKGKVLLSSGYSMEGEAKEILKRGCDAFIQKPFNLDQLSRKMREVLGKNQV